MTTYNTGNPVPSVDVRDLYDNAENLDSLVNGAAAAYPDRLGVSRKSFKGFENDFNAFLAASGFELPALEYIDSTPLVVDRPTQLIFRSGFPETLYGVKATESFPVTLTGTWATDQAKLVVRSDGDLRQDLSGADGSDFVGFESGQVFSQGTVGDRLSKYITVTDAPFNAVADAVTDNTAAILAAAIAAGPRGAIYIPPLVKYDFDALMDAPTMPVEVVVFDDSLINGGYLKDKLTGIHEKGDATAESDTSFIVSSGHNAGIFLDNTGKAAGGGGPARNVGITWTSGRYSKGGIPGAVRPVMRWEWQGSGDRWTHAIRKRAPFAAVTKNYFRWEAASPVVVAIGDFCFRQNRFYVADSAGTTGATPPTHTSGTVSDGGVNWTFYQFSYDQGIYSINDYGRIAINSALGTNFRRDRMSVDDPGDMIYTHEPVGNSKTVFLNYLPTDSGGVSTGTKQIQIAVGGFTFLIDSVIAGAFLSSGFNQRGLVKVASTAANGDTTPTVANIGTLTLNNSSATSVTTLDDGVTNQEVELVFQTANTTLVHSSGFQLTGSVNITPSVGSVVTMRRAPYSAIWIEVSRSIK